MEHSLMTSIDMWEYSNHIQGIGRKLYSIFILVISYIKMALTIKLLMNDEIGETYSVSLDKGEYQSNWRTALRLIDNEDGCPFSNLSVNIAHIKNEYQQALDRFKSSEQDCWSLEWIAVDNNFISIFDSRRECRDWIMDNLPFVEVTWYTDDEWYHIMYINKEKLWEYLLDDAINDSDDEPAE